MSDSEPNRNWKFPAEFSAINYRIIHSKSIPIRKDIYIYFSFLKVIKEIKLFRPDVVYLDGWESPSYMLAAWYLSKRTNAKLLIGYRSNVESHTYNFRIVRLIRSKIFSYANKIVTVGTTSTTEVIKSGVRENQIWELFNPVDTPTFSRLNQRSHEFDTAHKFLFVGQLIPRKNILNLLEAFAKTRRLSDSLTIVGVGELDLLIRRNCTRLGIEHRTFVLGHMEQEDLVKIYFQSHTLVMPSTNEVWGLVANEALAAGLHLVVSRISGVFSSVEHMEGVFGCDTTVESISESMRRSRETFAGYIENPEINRYSTFEFARQLSSKISADIDH